MIAHVIAAVWAGVVLGVSFLATPVKFRATSLSYDAALEVGRVTFHYLVRIEWLLLSVLAVAMLVAPSAGAVSVGLFALLGVVVGLQHGWLLGVMDDRVAGVIESRSRPPPSKIHHLYIAAELVKVASLLAIAML